MQRIDLTASSMSNLIDGQGGFVFRVALDTDASPLGYEDCTRSHSPPKVSMIREPLGRVAAADKLHLDAVGAQSGMVIKPTPIRCIRDRDAEAPRHGCEFPIRPVESGQLGHRRKILKFSSEGIGGQIDSFDAGRLAVKGQ